MGSPSTAFVKQYQDNITLLAQQMENRLRQTVMVDTNWTGEEKLYDQYATDDMVEIVSRLENTPTQSADHRRRKVVPRKFVSNTLEDPFEALQMLADPKSTYMMAKQASAARKADLIIIQAISAAAGTGKTGSTSVTLGSAQKTTNAGGLTIAKLVEANQILNAGEVEKEDRTLVHSARQMSDLLNSTTATSIDFNTVKALVQGEIDMFLGFKFVQSEQLETDSADARLCLAYQKKGVQFAIQKEAEGRLDERPDKNYAWQVYMKMVVGAVRLEEARVVQIPCVEA